MSFTIKNLRDVEDVAPPVVRAFAAGPDGLELLVLGPHCESDGEILQGDPWSDRGIG